MSIITAYINLVNELELKNQPRKPRSGLGMLNRVEQVLNGTLVLKPEQRRMELAALHKGLLDMCRNPKMPAIDWDKAPNLARDWWLQAHA